MNSEGPQIVDISDSDSVVEDLPGQFEHNTNETIQIPDDTSFILDLTAEEMDFINNIENDYNKNKNNSNLPGSSIENSISIDDDTFAFFVEAGLEDPNELKMLGIDFEEIHAQKRLADRLEMENKINLDFVHQLQNQYDFELGNSSTSNSFMPSSSSSTQNLAPIFTEYNSKRKNDKQPEESIKRIRLEDSDKGKSPIDVEQIADVIDLTEENDNDYIYVIDDNRDEEDDADSLDSDPLDYLSFVPWNDQRFQIQNFPTFSTPSSSGSGSSNTGEFDEFSGFRHLSNPFTNTNNQLIHNQDDSPNSSHLSRIHQRIQAHMEKHSRLHYTQQETEQELRKLLENIQDDEPPPPQDRTGTPEGLTINLLEHQKIGLQWMSKMENSNNKGGILADDMGLGKTIQAMAVIIQNPCTNATEVDPSILRNRRYTTIPAGQELRLKATLIVCPVSLMDQWRREIQEKTNPQLKVLVFHGPQRTTNPYDLVPYDVIISSYNVTATNFHENSKGPLSKVFFHRIILDEAHTIKNRNTIAAKGCCTLDATYRWCLTATPIQNKIDELYSLIRFLRIRPFSEWEEFRDTILKPMKSGHHTKGIKVAGVLMKAISLRRSKKAIIDGRPILDLPERNIHMTHIEFSPDERLHYDFVNKRAQARFNKYMQQGTVMKNYSSVLVLLLRLRQACLHPSLTLREGEGEIEVVDPQKEIDQAKSMKPEVVRRLLDESNTLQEIECPICMDIAQDAQIIKSCGHILCKECFDSYVNTNDGSPKRCPQCRGDMNRQNLVTIETFIKVYAPHLIKEAEEAEESEKGKENEALKKVQEFISSAKIDKMIDILDETHATTNGKDKTIVFSQFTGFLDLLDQPLKDRGYKFLRYDGSMDIKKRAETINTFHENSEYKVLLVSTKCGSLGLNLTCANRVILMDVWWNPALENQAIDRVHRIGQTKPVDVHRIFINNTVEDRILELQRKKQAIADGVLGEGSIRNAGRLGLQEMIYLFRGGDIPDNEMNNP